MRPRLARYFDEPRCGGVFVVVDLELLLVFVVNGAILAAAVWVVVKWMRARRRFTREASAKDHIAHWRYPANEWQRFCDAEAARIRRRDLPRVMKIFAGVAVVVAAFMWFKYDPAQYYIFDPRIAMLVLLAVIAVILAAIVLARAHWYLRQRNSASNRPFRPCRKAYSAP